MFSITKIVLCHVIDIFTSYQKPGFFFVFNLFLVVSLEFKGWAVAPVLFLVYVFMCFVSL